jgi:hypothetical protein
MKVDLLGEEMAVEEELACQCRVVALVERTDVDTVFACTSCGLTLVSEAWAFVSGSRKYCGGHPCWTHAGEQGAYEA